jgi:hypothetical protein
LIHITFKSEYGFSSSLPHEHSRFSNNFSAKPNMAKA